MVSSGLDMNLVEQVLGPSYKDSEEYRKLLAEAKKRGAINVNYDLSDLLAERKQAKRGRSAEHTGW